MAAQLPLPEISSVQVTLHVGIRGGCLKGVFIAVQWLTWGFVIL
ncbi:hypothetical protein SAZ11_49770 [Streptomyces sp. FXJ1.4098]|nr:hypothetical protein [Streptomyces sp. FXJ1.4098]